MEKTKVKKIISIVSIVILVTLIIGIIITYSLNEQVREYIDFNVLKKEKYEEKTSQIKLLDDKKSYVCAYGNNIGVLSNNILHIYNSYAKEQFKLNIEITDPIFKSEKQNLLIAEKSGNKVYFISGKNIIWQKDIVGEITKISINKNGYVAIIFSQNTYKTGVITLNPQGEELFKIFLSNSYAIDADISNDNKYVAIAELNTEGTQIKSSIRILALDKLETDVDGSTVLKKETDADQMIVSIKYNDANELIAMYDDGIYLIKNEENNKLIEFNTDTLFANIDSSKEIFEINQKHEESIESIAQLNMLNTINNKKNKYNLEEIPKELTVTSSKIAISTGREVYFISNNAWLIKKFTSKQEIKEIVLGEHIAGIVYNNKICVLGI